MAELNKIKVQSPELQEVMSEIPGRFLKWGLFIFFAFILILIISSIFIKNPEKVIVPIVLTTQNPPVVLVPKSGGEIRRLFVSEGSRVRENAVVAFISNSGNYEDVIKLNLFLLDFNGKTDWIKIVKSRNSPPDLSLGEIQSNYSVFQKEWKEMKDYIKQGYIPAKMGLLEKQIEKKLSYNLELAIQEKYLAEDLTLAKINFSRDSILNLNQVISSIEYEKSKQSYLQKLYSFSVFIASIKNNELDFLNMKVNLLDIQIQYEIEIQQFIFSLEESLQILKSSISQWEEKYVIKSPITGKITFNHFRNENQVIKAGETLATVIPDSLTNIIVRAVIPISGFGKIEIGQTVNIKLSGFPYMQYGVLKGKIYSVSQVPGEDGFTADIVLVEGMTSTYREKIRFIHDMNGTAEIITRNNRLINSFLNPIRSTLSNN